MASGREWQRRRQVRTCEEGRSQMEGKTRGEGQVSDGQLIVQLWGDTPCTYLASLGYRPSM